MITRLAPTPSGYLHLGNCVNFQLIGWFAEQHSAEVILRIDDMDADRYRREYVDDIFRVLDWLQIGWTIGPDTPQQFEDAYSTRLRREYYLRQLDDAAQASLVTYACECSRSDLRSVQSNTCVNDCRAKGVELETGRTALRVHVPPGTVVGVGTVDVDLAEAVGDYVVWRRDGSPAYHLVSVIEDRDGGVTHVIRGEDLIESTAAQLFLARGLQASAVLDAQFLHHHLLRDSAGHKLSKSQLREGPLPADGATREAIIDAATGLAPMLGIEAH
jgi:glutamyl-tRNA synthetase